MLAVIGTKRHASQRAALVVEDDALVPARYEAIVQRDAMTHQDSDYFPAAWTTSGGPDERFVDTERHVTSRAAAVLQRGGSAISGCARCRLLAQRETRRSIACAAR